MNSYKYGLFAEYFIIIYLILKGYKVLERRYKTKVGEVDIIATKNKDLIAFEVKARRRQNLTTEIVSNNQTLRIKKALNVFILYNNKFVDYNNYYNIILYKNMFNFTIVKEF